MYIYIYIFIYAYIYIYVCIKYVCINPLYICIYIAKCKGLADLHRAAEAAAEALGSTLLVLLVQKYKY